MSFAFLLFYCEEGESAFWANDNGERQNLQLKREKRIKVKTHKN